MSVPHASSAIDLLPDDPQWLKGSEVKRQTLRVDELTLQLARCLRSQYGASGARFANGRTNLIELAALDGRPRPRRRLPWPTARLRISAFPSTGHANGTTSVPRQARRITTHRASLVAAPPAAAGSGRRVPGADGCWRTRWSAGSATTVCREHDPVRVGRSSWCFIEDEGGPFGVGMQKQVGCSEAVADAKTHQTSRCAHARSGT